jgi:asparagine synthase (glutamine-hydrolysing)
LSEEANQPFFDLSQRYAMVYNGEIYNFREVRAMMPDLSFRTDSDTEVILAAYIKFGPRFLSLLNGMFAIAIWDREKKELFVARDRLGVKPLYYSHRADSFVFASEIRAILDSGLVDRKLNNDALFDYVMYQSVYEPETLVENVRQLPAGEYGVFSRGNFSTHSYWKLEESDSEPVADDASAVKKNVRELLLRSVERRMISDVRLGAFLSGGIDSSAIVALMSEVSDRPVDTFSVNFGEKEYDESRYSSLIAEKYRTSHTAVNLNAADFLSELPNALAAVDSPSGDGLNTFVVSKATKKAGITVALSGLGGDELFVGYPNFLKWYKTQTGPLSKVPSVFKRPVAMALASSGNSKYQRAADMLSARTADIAGIYPMFRQVMSDRTVADVCGRPNRGNRFREMLRSKGSEISGFPILSQFTIAELLGYTRNVLLKDTDQFSMASALEVREPFFDYKLVEYVLRIPDAIKYPKYPKSLLVESLRPMLPDEIVHRPKMGFVLPFDNWMRGELKDFCQNRLESLADRGILNPTVILKKWADFQNGANGVLWSHLWHLVILSEWLSRNRFYQR